jgi:hypothetical protein
MPVIATLIFSADATGMPPPVDGPGGPGGPAGPSVPDVPAAPSLPLQPAKRRPISNRAAIVFAQYRWPTMVRLLFLIRRDTVVLSLVFV